MAVLAVCVSLITVPVQVSACRMTMAINQPSIYLLPCNASWRYIFLAALRFSAVCIALPYRTGSGDGESPP